MKTSIKVSIKVLRIIVIFFVKVNFSIIFIFSIRRNTIFSRMNIIFFNDTGNVIFKRIFSGEDYLCFCDRRVTSYLQEKNIIFTEYSENIMFPRTFWERSSFIFRLRSKVIFLGEKIPFFLIIKERSYSSVIFFGNTVFSEHLEKESMAFRVVLKIEERHRIFTFFGILKMSQLWMHLDLGKKLHTLLNILIANLWFFREANRCINGLTF